MKPPLSGAPRRVLLQSCCWLLLVSCGGNDAPAPPDSPPSTALVVQPGSAAADRAMPGQARVMLNPEAALPPLADRPSPAAQALPAEPAATVAVTKDADGSVRLQQRDGSTRKVSRDGTITRGHVPTGERPDTQGTLIVAVDAGNTVFMVDPDACESRKVSPDGRVVTTLLPAASGGAPCQAGPPSR